MQEVSLYYQEEGQLAVRADITRNAYDASQAGGDLVLSLTEGVLKTTRVVAMNPDDTVPEAVKQRILAAADRPHCEAFSQEEDGETLVSVVVQHTKLQELRDIVDALLVDLADIEESA